MMRYVCTINYRDSEILKKMKRTKIKRIATSIMTFVCLQNTNIKMNQEIYHTNNGINTNKAIVLLTIFEYN